MQHAQTNMHADASCTRARHGLYGVETRSPLWPLGSQICGLAPMTEDCGWSRWAVAVDRCTEVRGWAMQTARVALETGGSQRFQAVTSAREGLSHVCEFI